MQKRKNYGKKRGIKLKTVFIFILLIGALISILIILIPKSPDLTVNEQDNYEISQPDVKNVEEILPVEGKTDQQKPPIQPSVQTPTQPSSIPLEDKTKPQGPPAEQKKPVETRLIEIKPANTIDRSIYFMKDETNSGEMLLEKVHRKIEVSVSPLTDCINSLLQGPTAEEKNIGIISLIPAKTRLISARIAENVAFLNFNDDFKYNASGRDAQYAQIKQIVYTATEFETVKSVQFLIEGQKVDFLPEGVMIRDPLGR